ncbi:hypothetical protein RhiirA5_73975 [Rhizophagus irregularis]|uniref:FAR1 domain-containing protein n=1 Tax=Rhizophagus irregularis TaxID=588596 RepID=A0A2N0QFW3_9GLOM|nr:hypothetical protein RhiirA5_73975 [Rhizophagus irregularis]
MKLEHNHEMDALKHKKFLGNERTIHQDRIIAYHQAGCISTTRSILKQECKNSETWIYSDIYNFIYQLVVNKNNVFFEAEVP